ncbi:hypothetical protein ACPCHQ_17030 [Ralstonia thomasii]|jgi:hypothetical protein|uniref:Scaffolding protein n=2 Tax=Ralstonia TaxID=48736 RepID=A0ABM9JW11_9RALS|nr:MULTISPECIES: hypothetical protein [Ralstonia]MBT2181020.1 hypothetical protein [Ralstonia pickettii]CAJ0710694.1 hypothetical protein LMG7143_01690 [Ralstonia sp. LMG 18095]CAJ0806286.1 hypothetical protein LMG18095_04415 [Ralstonia sp. LMG 18095]
MADVPAAEAQTVIPTGEQSTQQQSTAGELEHQPGNQDSSATGAEQHSQQQQVDPESQHQGEQGKGDSKRTPWYQHRINELTRERKEAAERETREREGRERAERELAALRQGSQGTQDQQSYTPAPQSATQQPVDMEAAKQEWMRQKSFDDACTAIYNAGAKEYSDFDSALKQIGMVGEIPQHFLEAAVNLEDGHKVLYHLGQNPEIAAEMLSLPPVKLAIRMASLKGQLDRPKTQPVSQASAPIKPISGSGAADVDLSKASLDDFMERRNREAPVKR